MTSSAATVETCHVQSSSPLAWQQRATPDQVQGYSDSEVETDAAALELETNAVVSHEISKHERYSAD
jgi:hypothetical protein